MKSDSLQEFGMQALMTAPKSLPCGQAAMKQTIVTNDNDKDLKVTVMFAVVFVFIDHNLCTECGITLAFLLPKLVLKNRFIVEVQATVCVHLFLRPFL